MRMRNDASGRCLQLLAAMFVLLGPTVLGSVCRGWGLYAVFALLAAMLLARVIKSGSIHISVNILLGALALCYALAELLWADSVFSHVRLIFIMLTALSAMLLAADYFALENQKNIGGRLEYLFIVAATLCAAWNIVYWAICTGFSLAAPFKAGIGNSDLLGIFMLAGILCCVRRLRANGRIKKELVFMGIAMLFVLVMSRSLAALLFAAAWPVIGEKKHKIFSLPFGAVAVIGAGLLAVCGALKLNRPYIDGLLCALRQPAGLGGGGFLSRRGELQSAFYRTSELGLGADVASSMGVAGLILALVFLGRLVYVALKRRRCFDAFMSMVSIFVLFVYVGGSLGALMLILCALVYGEWNGGEVKEHKLGGARYIFCAVLLAAALYGCVLGTGEAVSSLAKSKIKSDPKEAVSLFDAAIRITPFDANSSYLAAKTLCDELLDGGSKNDAVLAEYHIGKAIELEPDNAAYYECFGRIERKAGKLAEAAEQYEKAIRLAPKWEKLKVDCAKCLYSLIQTMEKGSVETEQCYERLLELGEAAQSMENKKLINDIADKAQPYTRPDLGYSFGEDAE